MRKRTISTKHKIATISKISTSMIFCNSAVRNLISIKKTILQGQTKGHNTSCISENKHHPAACKLISTNQICFTQVKAGWVLNILGVVVISIFINTYGMSYFDLYSFPEWAALPSSELTTMAPINVTGDF